MVYALPILVKNGRPGGDALQEAQVRDLVRRVLQPHAADERMLDGYWQWASNPTPSSAGYALEENCGFIATNLLGRYGQPAIELVSQLAGECRQMREDAGVEELRQAILAILNDDVGEVLRAGIARRLSESVPARRVLAAWLVSRARWCSLPGREGYIGGAWDWALGVDLEAGSRDLKTEVAQALGTPPGGVDLAREAVAVGIVNRLFYRNVAGRMEPKLRPGPRIPVALVAYA